MNTAIVHKIEREFFMYVKFVFTFLLLALVSFLLATYVWVLSLQLIFLFLSIFCMLLGVVFLGIAVIKKSAFDFKIRNWRKEGENLSKQIGLKRILLLESDLVSEFYPDASGYEIHHKQSGLFKGLVLMFRSQARVKKELYEELTYDFKKLAAWASNKESIVLFTTTHPKMMSVWKKTADSYFEITPLGKLLDPWIGMNRIQWMLSTFSTTGRMNFTPPKKWETYFFDLRR